MRTLIFLLLFLISCKAQENNYKIYSIIVDDFGKICLNNNEINKLSKISDINIKNLTSSLYSGVNNNKTCFVVNDETFDYYYFNKNKINLLNKKINIYCKIFNELV